MHIHLVYDHLFYKYFVRRSVGQVTKSKKGLRYLWMLSFLFYDESKLGSIGTEEKIVKRKPQVLCYSKVKNQQKIQKILKCRIHREMVR